MVSAWFVCHRRAGPTASIACALIPALPRTRVALGRFSQSSVAEHPCRDKSSLPLHGALRGFAGNSTALKGKRFKCLSANCVLDGCVLLCF